MVEAAAARQQPAEDEWLAELERRAREAHAGAPGIPWSEAREKIEDALGLR